MSSNKTFPCNTCELVFDNSQAQRTHMREPWHVYNLKRRMASLPPISSDNYSDKVATKLVTSKQETSEAPSSSVATEAVREKGSAEQSYSIKDPVDEPDSTNRCLFCTKNLDDAETNLDHMSSEHGLYFPEIENISNLEATIGYLRTVVTQYKECLYCGIFKNTAEGIRRHMLDKGHCMINLEREPELLEFWEFSGSDENDSDDEEAQKARTHKTNAPASTDLSQGEITLPSGKILRSKNEAREARRLARRTASAAKDTPSQSIAEAPKDDTAASSSADPGTVTVSNQQGNQSRTLAVRDAAGLIGVSDQQMRGLVTIERKMQRQQAIVRASARWADELGGTHQKHYKQKMNLRDG